VKAFGAGRSACQLEPSEQHKNALGKEGTRKPGVTLNKIRIILISQHKKLSEKENLKRRKIAFKLGSQNFTHR
jgi:hypothetical protein